MNYLFISSTEVRYLNCILLSSTISSISYEQNKFLFDHDSAFWIFSYKLDFLFILLLLVKMSVPLLYSYARCPFCRSVLMLSKHLNFKLNIQEVNLGRKEHLTPEYGKMNPQHCVPTIDDNGFHLWESRAILAYLANKYAPENKVYPKDPKERAIVDRMLYFDIGTLYKAEGDYLYPQLFKGQPADPEKAEAFKKALSLLEGFLSKTAYVAGDHITLADFSIVASLSFAEAADYSYADYPKITAWMEKLKSEIPSYKEINDVPLQQFKEFLKSKK